MQRPQSVDVVRREHVREPRRRRELAGRTEVVAPSCIRAAAAHLDRCGYRLIRVGIGADRVVVGRVHHESQHLCLRGIETFFAQEDVFNTAIV